MKIFKKIHLWLSVPFGIVISIICLTGGIMVFRSEIEELTHPSLYHAEYTGSDPLPLDSLVSLMSAHYEHPVSVRDVSISNNRNKAYKIRLGAPEKTTIYVDQYSGKINGEYERCQFFSTMFRLHRWLLGSRPEEGIFWGKMIIGVSTIAFALILISGLVIWWPKNLQKLKKRLSISCTKGAGRFFHDLHVSAGFYFTIILLASALTGLTWSFTWYKDAFYGILSPATQKTEKAPQKSGVKKGKTVARYENWEKALQTVKTENPGFYRISAYNGTIDLDRSSWGSTRDIDTYSFDNATGEITDIAYYKDMDRDRKVRGWVYTLHVGAWGGIFGKTVTLLAMLIGASLPFTGYYLWIKKIITKKGKKHHKDK